MQRLKDPNRTVAIVVAAGRGARFGGSVPKQYVEVAGRPILSWSLAAALAHPAVGRALAVIDPADVEAYARAAVGLDLLPPVAGGPTRQASVRAGLEALADDPPTYVLVHDGARPCAPPGLFGRVLDGLGSATAVVPTLPVADTLRRFEGDLAAGEVDREGLHRVQTPQGFDFAALLAAHRSAGDGAATDDAALVLAAGGTVARVEGEASNLKVTTVPDLEEAARRLAPRPPVRWATGLGFDVHRLVPGRRLVLLGVDITHELGLEGHSDADVALHAVTDAILGALGEGDIGVHFPPSDPKWRDADSAGFARHAVGLAAAAGATIEHVDVTIVGERPRIGPYRAALRERLASILGVDVARASVKATTTERLGFAGRGEGLAAQAVATLAFREGSRPW